MPNGVPTLIATSARSLPGAERFAQLRSELDASGEPYLLLLGTGWGLAEEVIERCPRRLEPVTGAGAYNHLSVRAAAAIILDRLRGTR